MNSPVILGASVGALIAAIGLAVLAIWMGINTGPITISHLRYDVEPGQTVMTPGRAIVIPAGATTLEISIFGAGGGGRP